MTSAPSTRRTLVAGLVRFVVVIEVHSDGHLLVHSSEHSLEAFVDLGRDVVECGVLRDTDQLLWIDGTYHDVAVVRLIDGHVTWEQCPKIGLSGEPLVGDRRVAGTENPILVDVDIELFLQCCLDLEITEDAEAFVLQGSRDSSDSVVELCVGRRGDGVRHGFIPSVGFLRL